MQFIKGKASEMYENTTKQARPQKKERERAKKEKKKKDKQTTGILKNVIGWWGGK